MLVLSKIIMTEIKGEITIFDPEWTSGLLVKEIELEKIINYLNSEEMIINPSNGYEYIRNYAINVVNMENYRCDRHSQILPFRDLILFSQNTNLEESKKALTCIKSCRISFINFRETPNGEYNYVMVFQDLDTKFTILKPLKSVDTCNILGILIEIFALIGVPSAIVTSEKDKVKIILEQFSYFCENFDCKVESPDIKDEKDADTQQVKLLIETWMKNNNNKWSDILNHIQFDRNCTYNKNIKAFPFDELFKPNYEYAQNKYTRYLIYKQNRHKQTANEKIKLNEEPKLNSVKSDNNNNFYEELSIEQDVVYPKEAIQNNTNELYLTIEPADIDCLTNYDYTSSLIHIYDNTNIYSKKNNQKHHNIEGTSNKHIVIYKRARSTVRLCTEDYEDKIRNATYDDSSIFTNQTDVKNTLKNSNENKTKSRSHSKLTQTKSRSGSNVELCMVCKKKKKRKKKNKKQFSLYRESERFKIGDPVRLRTPLIERHKGSPNFISAVIVDKAPNGEYKLGTPDGILKEPYSSDYLLDCNHEFFKLENIPLNKLINIQEVLIKQGKESATEELVKCTCNRNIGYCNPNFSYHNQCIFPNVSPD